MAKRKIKNKILKRFSLNSLSILLGLTFIVIAGGFYLYQGITQQVKALEPPPPPKEIIAAEISPSRADNSYQVGETVTVTWRLNPASGSYEDDTISIYWGDFNARSGGLARGWITEGTEANNLNAFTGNYTFEIPASAVSTGTLDRFIYLDLSGPFLPLSAAPEYSLGPFTFILPPPVLVPSIEVISPNGGEEWILGSSQSIQWEVKNGSSIELVRIDLSRDGGSSYQDLGRGQGEFWSWEVSGTATSQALIRISFVDYPAVSDVSNGVFSIAEVVPPDETKTGTYLSASLPFTIEEGERLKSLDSLVAAGNLVGVTFELQLLNQQEEELTDLLEVTPGQGLSEDGRFSTALNDARFVKFQVTLTGSQENPPYVQSLTLNYTVSSTEPPQGTYNISGKVATAAGEGIGGVLITAGTLSTQTDAGGNYTLSNLENGTYLLTPSRSGYNFQPESQEVEVADGDRTEVDFTAGSLTSQAVSLEILLPLQGGIRTTNTTFTLFIAKTNEDYSLSLVRKAESLALSPANRATHTLEAGSLEVGGSYRLFAKTNQHLSGEASSALTISPNQSSYTVIFSTLLAGDITPAPKRDDQVNIFDFQLFQNTYGSTSSLLADFDNNGWVGVADFMISILPNYFKNGALLNLNLTSWL